MCAPAWVEEARRARAALPPSAHRALIRCEATLAKRPPKVPKPGPGVSNEQYERAGRWLVRLWPVFGRRWVQRLAIAESYIAPLRPLAHEVLALELTRRHVLFGLPSPPAEILRAAIGMNRAMYRTMWGPNEFLGTGRIAAFDVLDRLSEIDLPVLITSGRYEMASPTQMQAALDRLPNGRWELFHESSHGQPFEEPDRYTDVLRDFLGEVDAKDRHVAVA
jgi:pimeloyl-ACP methyl ester carboxylesterase